jgi:hypothetical protein
MWFPDLYLQLSKQINSYIRILFFCKLLSRCNSHYSPILIPKALLYSYLVTTTKTHSVHLEFKVASNIPILVQYSVVKGMHIP